MMESCLPNASTRELRARARFEALRRRVFDDMGRASARWRLTWLLPFHVLVIFLLVVRGESATRALIQGVLVGLMGVVSVARVLWANDWRVKVGSLLFGVVGYFVMLTTTGGLASPLLATGALMLTTVAMTLREPSWLRQVVFTAFLGGYLALALLSSTAVGALDGPLWGSAGHASVGYVSLTLVAVVFAMVGVYGLSCSVARGYERAALELAERREELCSESVDRTRALEGIAARLAHEVKNPLAAIKALSTHMARNATDPKTSERLAIVAAEADRLQTIVEGFLSFSHGLDDLKPGPVRPYEVARELAVLLETRGAEAGVVLDVTGDSSLVVDADARKLRQALLNLVLNAIHASPRGATVELSVGVVSDGARITVHDDGAGMTPEVLDRIRKPYFTTKEGGTGLGVAVARGLVEQHGGCIAFRSGAGKGTTVVITLPIKAKTSAALPNPARAPKYDGAEADSPSEPAIAAAR